MAMVDVDTIAAYWGGPATQVSPKVSGLLALFCIYERLYYDDSSVNIVMSVTVLSWLLPFSLTGVTLH